MWRFILRTCRQMHCCHNQITLCPKYEFSFCFKTRVSQMKQLTVIAWYNHSWVRPPDNRSKTIIARKLKCSWQQKNKNKNKHTMNRNGIVIIHHNLLPESQFSLSIINLIMMIARLYLSDINCVCIFYVAVGLHAMPSVLIYSSTKCE